VTSPLLAALGIDLDALTDAIAEKTAARLRADLPTAPTGLLTKRQIAGAIGVSVATIDRFDREGAPFERVGASKRYDLEIYRAWVAARGAKPTTPEVTTARTSTARPDADTERLLEAGGLRLVGGTRR